MRLCPYHFFLASHCTGMSQKCVLHFHLGTQYSMSSKQALLVGYHICDIFEHCNFWVLQLHTFICGISAGFQKGRGSGRDL